MKIVEILRNIKKEDILVSERVRRKIQDKGLDVDGVLNKIFDFGDLLVESRQNGSFELIYGYGGKYSLVVILFVDGKVRLATAWKSSKSIEKLLKRATHIYEYNKRISLDKVNR